MISMKNTFDQYYGRDKIPNIVKRIKLKRQTKLICTLDDKWNNYENICKILKLGVDGIEIYSEMKEETTKDIIAKVKTYANENNQYIPIILNLSYFRVYISQINRKDENEISLSQNASIYIVNDKMNLDSIESRIKAKSPESIIIIENEFEKRVTFSDFNFIVCEPLLNFDNFTNQDVIHINYGEVSFKVEEIKDDYIKCVSLNSGVISKFNSLSVEGKEHFSNNLISPNEEKLQREIDASIRLGVEFVVVSVISNAVEEIKKIKGMLSNINVIVRLDNQKSIQNIDEYIELADSIYFSRSDLNLKDSLSKICFYQKSIVSKCGYLGVPVIVAGTFLDTMRTLPNPIRAEISDLYNTILQGIDCLLLTTEIIFGNYPYEVVETINEICSSCEKRVDYSNLFLEILYKTQKPMKIVEAVASSTVKTSFNLQTPFIVCVTEKGTASRIVAKYRPYCPVISITSKPSIAHSLAIYRGIFSIIFEDTYNTDAVIAHANDFLIKSKLISVRSNIVLLSGLNEKKNGTTDQMRVITLM